MKTISVCNQKGGAGKTTSAAAIAAGLARRGFRVLAADTDPQHNLSDVFSTFAPAVSLLDVLNGKPVGEVIQHTAAGFDLLPGSLDLVMLPQSFNLDSLRSLLAPLAASYDFAVIDTPPALSLLTMAALAASDVVVIPAQPEVFSLYGLDQIAETVEAVRPRNPGLKIAGVLLTRYNARRTLDKTMRDTLSAKAEAMGTRVFETAIRPGVAVSEAQLLRVDLFSAFPRSTATQDYTDFITELLKEI